MLLLGISLASTLLFLVPVSATPLNPRALNPAAVPDAYQSPSWSALASFKAFKRAVGAKRAIRGPTGFQSRVSESSEASVTLEKSLPSSNSPEILKAKTDNEDDDIDCFPTGSRLPHANTEDCQFVINFIILGMKDPLREQTWGYTGDVDINLSLPENRWVFKDCAIRVQNLHKSLVDRFRPVDVAELAQRIVQQCVTETKESLGGNANIGRLGILLSFYVVVSGTASTRGESLRNSTILSLPLNEPRALQSRASVVPPEGNTSPIISTDVLNADKSPIHCFDPTGVHRLEPAIASDCSLIINEIILRLPNLMVEQTFGYTDAVDINLSNQDKGRWFHGQCVVFVMSLDTTAQDRFNFLDVAYTAHRIMGQCIEGSEYAIGGTADVGTMENTFFVGVGGTGMANPGNGTILRLASNTGLSSLSGATPAPPMIERTKPASSHYNGTELVDLAKRSGNITELLQAIDDFAPTVRCLRSGMPAARKINIQDCTNAAMVLLSEPNVLTPQRFTTEPTGGIEMPFVQQNKSCYLMMDTKSDLSISDTLPLLKVVYWALEIMLACVSGREQGFGGVSKLDLNKGIFVSVTGVDPTPAVNELASLSDESTSATGSDSTSWQIVDLR